MFYMSRYEICINRQAGEARQVRVHRQRKVFGLGRRNINRIKSGLMSVFVTSEHDVIYYFSRFKLGGMTHVFFRRWSAIDRCMGHGPRQQTGAPKPPSHPRPIYSCSALCLFINASLRSCVST